MPARVLIAAGDPADAEWLAAVLGREGFATATTPADQDAVLSAVGSWCPEVILLDLLPPMAEGIELCRWIRAADQAVPIIMLTATPETGAIVAGLDAGADDCVLRPVHTRELVARVRARLRRRGLARDVERLGDLTIDLAAHEVTRDDIPLAVTPVEFDLLLTLARHPGHVLTRERLLHQVWRHPQPASTRLVNTHIQRLREKVESSSTRSAPG